MHSRRTILTIGVAITISFLALLAWRAKVWHAHGWTGLRYVVGTPDGVSLPPILAEKVPRSGTIDVVLPGSPAERAGIRAHDVLVTIDGLRVSDVRSILRHAELSRRGDTIVYRITRGSAERTVALRSESPLTFPNVASGIVAGVVMMFAFLTIAFLVTWNRPKSRAATIFFWFCVAGTAWSAMMAFLDLEMLAADGIYAAFSRLPVFLFYLLALAVANAFETVLLHLALVFPRELPLLRKRPWLVGWMYAVPLTLALLPFGVIGMLIAKGTAIKVTVGTLLALVAVLLIARRENKPWLHRPVTLIGIAVCLLHAILAFVGLAAEPLTIALTVAFSIVIAIVSGLATAFGYVIATLVSLAMGYRHSTAEEKRQLRWPLWGTAIALAISLTLSGLMVSGLARETMYLFSGAARLVYILIPLSFAVAILKYRLMEIDVVIKKTVVYSIATGLVLAVFFLLVAGIGSYITATLRIRSQTLTVFATLAVVAVFVPVRNRVQRAVERRFFQRSYDASEAQKLIQQEILSASSLEDVLPRIAEYVQQALQVKSIVIFTQRDEDPLFRWTAKIGVARETIGNFALDAASLARIDDVADVSALRLSDDERARVKRLQGELVVPLTLRDRTRGVMLVGSMLSGRFDEDDRRFLSDVAQQIAFAIEKLTITDEMRDFERALEIQRALLPKSLPRVEGVQLEAVWQPARTVGGDYYDVLPLAPGTLALCIGDVAGKGMPAALLMANLQAAVKASATAELQPHEVCTKVGAVVNGTLTGGRFVTFFFATIDLRARVLRYTNAGHNPPMLLRADGSVDRLSGGGPVFARLMHGAQYTTFEEPLRDGDMLVLFTDGVTEARDAGEEEFGEARLLSVARSGTARIVEEVQRFCGGAAQDDLTLLVARI
ncbi:MAG TPA: SpoIIE family protein phosphatase [Thermoanaerobaculia bacterium]|nr:SpoIIE family protein phosphatase [Thermoanaerobaculia bacterium]